MAEVLTSENLPRYIIEHKSSINVLPENAEESDLKASTISGGNVNYAFCVTVEAEAPVKFFVKQAPEFVAIFGPDGYPLTSERMQKEMDIYNAWKGILKEELASRYLPQIYNFDRRRMAVVMEFFDGYVLLDDAMVKIGAAVPKSVASGLGEFMGLTHAATHSSAVTEEMRNSFTVEYENRPMRDVQLEFVFTKCYVEATEEQRAGLNLSEAFLAEVDSLKSAYDGKTVGSTGHVLSHGDLHPGSVMIREDFSGSPKVIDPEFCVYGPPGLDVGSLLSGFVLAAVHHAHSGKDKDTVKSVTSICDGVSAVWEAYAEALLASGKVDPSILPLVAAESVGFAVAEVCRTALGFAGGRLWLQFDNPELKAKAIKAAMGIVQSCMIERHEGGMNLLVSELRKLVKA